MVAVMAMGSCPARKTGVAAAAGGDGRRGSQQSARPAVGSPGGTQAAGTLCTACPRRALTDPAHFDHPHAHRGVGQAAGGGHELRSGGGRRQAAAAVGERRGAALVLPRGASTHKNSPKLQLAPTHQLLAEGDHEQEGHGQQAEQDVEGGAAAAQRRVIGGSGVGCLRT